MSDTVTVIDRVDSPEHFRSICFDLQLKHVVKFPEKIFEKYWGYFRHVFVTDGSRKQRKYGWAQYFLCRLKNDPKSYIPVAPEDRKRKASQRTEEECNLRVSTEICLLELIL
jgi:hypothetical protein